MKILKLYSPCRGQCRIVAREFKDNPINVHKNSMGTLLYYPNSI